MRTPGFLLVALALVLGPCAAPSARASGFGWYVCSVEWHEHVQLVQGLKDQAADLLADADTPKLRAFLQADADSQIVKQCEGADESPRSMEFYSRLFVASMLSEQKRRGIDNSFFAWFQSLPEAIEIEKRDHRALIDPVYFVLSPPQVKAFHAELVELNRLPHPTEERLLLQHLAAVLSKTMADTWGTDESDANAMKLAEEFGNGERGIIFYGHD